VLFFLTYVRRHRPGHYGPTITEPALGASHTVASQTQGPAYDTNFVQNDNFIQINQGFPGQLYQYPEAPTPNYGLNGPSTAGFQVDGSFTGQPVPVFEQPNFQWTGMNSTLQNPSLTNYGTFGGPYTSGFAMDDLTMNAPFMPNTEPVSEIADWPVTRDLDAAMMDNPMIPVAPDINSVQQIITSVPQAPPGLAQAPIPAQVSSPRVACTHCPQTFVRDYDRVRHENSKHNNGPAPAARVCLINGCPKSQGGGYTRADKLTEHMWKKHAALGYTKRT